MGFFQSIRKKLDFLLFKSGTVAMETLLYVWAAVHGMWVLYQHSVFYHLPTSYQPLGSTLNVILGLVFVLTFLMGLLSLLVEFNCSITFRAWSTFVIFCSCLLLFLVYLLTYEDSVMVPTYLVLTVGSLWVHLRIKSM